MYKTYVKRLLDILLSIIGMPFLTLAIMVLAPVIYLSDRGSVFYNAPRLGKDGKVFKMYKFRSMKVNAPDIRNDDGSTYNSNDDPRVTKIGRILRKTSIDELPQLFNVLLGNMSFVGPRPNLPPESFEALSQLEKARVTVRPGITGYNQAYYRNSVPPEQRYEYDIQYIKHLSFLLDVKILLKTAISIVKLANINKNDSVQCSTIVDKDSIRS